jgi:dihydrofolate reductase
MMMPMRKVVLFMGISLDGYIEAPGRRIDWHRVDEELHRHMNEELAPMGAFLHGRTTYELMADFWPTADSDPANAGPMADFAPIWRDKPKIVYSRTLERADWNSTIVRDVVPDEVRALREQPGGDLCLGGAGLAASFLRQDLVDAYQIYVHPVLVGDGTPLFPSPAPERALELTRTRTFGNGVVLLRYERAAG